MRSGKSIAGIALLLSAGLGISSCSDSSSFSVHPNDNENMYSLDKVESDADVKLSYDRVQVSTQAAPVAKPFPMDMEHPISETATLAQQPSLTTTHPQNDQAWIQATMAKYGVYPEAGTRFVIGPMPEGCSGADGCTQFKYYTDTGVAFDYVITIVPGQLTEYLLFHEIGHARGIRDECGADNFARSVLGPVPGHYC